MASLCAEPAATTISLCVTPLIPRRPMSRFAASMIFTFVRACNLLIRVVCWLTSLLTDSPSHRVALIDRQAICEVFDCVDFRIWEAMKGEYPRFNVALLSELLRRMSRGSDQSGALTAPRRGESQSLTTISPWDIISFTQTNEFHVSTRSTVACGELGPRG